MKKKGVTPLMITFLLVSFAVAISVVIMNLGQAEIESEAQCSIQVGLTFAKISSVDQICYDPLKKELTFTVENGLNIPVEGLIVNIIGTQKAETFEVHEAAMTRAGNYLGHTVYDVAVSGEIKQVKISPTVILTNKEEICREQALVVEEVPLC